MESHAPRGPAADRLTVAIEMPAVRIEPSQGWSPLHLRELWDYRELIYFLIWRDIKVRYKQTSLGIAWAVLQPLLAMLIFSVIFGRLAQLPSDGVPYPVFSFAALLPWQLFASSLTGAANSLVGNASLVTKVYFPRLVIPVAAVAATLVDFVIACVVLVALMGWYGIAPPSVAGAALALPLFALLALVTALAVGLWSSALNVEYRDVRYLLPYVLQVWLFASPVAYSVELVPEGLWRTLYGVNPMAGVIQGFRWALLGSPPPGAWMVVSVVVTLVLLVTGLYYFRRMEDTFADVI